LSSTLLGISESVAFNTMRKGGRRHNLLKNILYLGEAGILHHSPKCLTPSFSTPQLATAPQHDRIEKEKLQHNASNSKAILPN